MDVENSQRNIELLLGHIESERIRTVLHVNTAVDVMLSENEIYCIYNKL